jgi:transcription elongation factor GreB
VLFEDDAGAKKKWQIVGEGESDTALGTISWKSPMARALLGKQVGDVVTVERPAGEIEVEILELWFGERRIA